MFVDLTWDIRSIIDLLAYLTRGTGYCLFVIGVRHFCSPEFLGKLKSMDLLRNRGKRAGRLNKQKSMGNGLRIPVICSGRRHYSVSLNIQNATSRLQICESRPLGVNVNNLICIRPDPLRSKLSTVVPLDFCLLNARSICNKSRLINDFIADHNIDLFALSETWLRGDDSDLYYFRDICPDGYVFHHVLRLHTTGGGVGTSKWWPSISYWSIQLHSAIYDRQSCLNHS